MSDKLTEGEKLKYWIDAEFSILHAMWGTVMYNLVDGKVLHILFGVYIAWCLIYGVVRVAYISLSDSNYLRVPKK